MKSIHRVIIIACMIDVSLFYTSCLKKTPEPVHGVDLFQLFASGKPEREICTIIKIGKYYPKDLNAVNDSNQTPLQLAASYGWPEVITTLIDAGADPNMSTEVFLDNTHIYRCTPLYMAVCYEKDNCIAALVNGGADVNAELSIYLTDGSFQLLSLTPLNCACELNNNTAFEYLQKHGGDIEHVYYRFDEKTKVMKSFWNKNQ